MEILPSYNRVCHIVRLHHLSFNKTSGGKPGWEKHKINACCFEKILEAATEKKAAVLSLTSDFSNHQRRARHVGNCWKSKDQLMSNVPMDSYTWAHQC